MKTSDFYYELPESSIAQTPLERRDQSKLMVLNRGEGTIKHAKFSALLDYLEAGDCLVLNNTAVLPARLFGRRSSGARVEFLLLTEVEKDVWHCLVKPGRKAKVGDAFTFSDRLSATVEAIEEGGIRRVRFSYRGNFYEIIEQIGEMPLPPYIHETLDDGDRYQTVYKKDRGSAAAPTAGLHFTPELLAALQAKGVQLAYLTLHVGIGTFRPVSAACIEDHTMHAEWYQLDQENAARIVAAKRSGGRIVAVGTTSVRTLESVYKQRGAITQSSGWTDIFIYPGYKYNVVDALLTNFHLPESTLLMLVSAFYNREEVLKAYRLAVAENYRFFSFGDAMFIM